MKETHDAPVLLIAFSRPDTTLKVMEVLEKVQPKKLYVAIDGPRPNRPEEIELTKEVARITKQINWDCDVNYLIRKENFGGKLGVYNAISWVFETEDRAIIIEDDIIAVPEFFNFAGNLLERYKADERIAMISANNYTPIKISEDYVFSNYGHIWGWATWKRVWDQFDVSIPELDKKIKENLHSMNFATEKEKKFHVKYFKKTARHIINQTDNFWDSQFVFFRLNKNLLSIVPKVNLASNIGETSSRTETNNSESKEHYFESHENFNLNKHPTTIELNKEYDNHHFNNHIDKLSLSEKVIYKLKKKLNIK